MASTDDLRMMARWAADEGWNPGAVDSIAFASADPQAFLIGRVEGQPATCISVVRYGDGFGFLGFYIARIPFRGKGYGLSTWHAGMRRLAGRNVGLDGVVDQQDSYRASGFARAWTNLRYSGTPAQASPPPQVDLIDGRTLPFNLITGYDRRFFPAEREAFLACWLGLPGHTTLAAMRDGHLAGLGVLRPSHLGSRIGPLYAQSPDVAAALISALATPAAGPIFIDVPDLNPAAVALAEQLNLKPEFETARMYTGPVPSIEASGLYGITSLELG
ncbi:N-acetyltransferase GCN5 [Rhizocola hellebori]|uniref:N-acetyltransferase GCN5 n=1 Tax=Rhizocola hellebori TaxID=1392758 RepID=A0A8J3Q830_9ACTN|nr:GNAT family N-acetyltransferase [Rhizocola hellebori]GIH05580.1 N-acetyltransferase GCN5 [Rhizocola hellebori]